MKRGPCSYRDTEPVQIWYIFGVEAVHADGALKVVVKGPRTVMVAPVCSSRLEARSPSDERLQQEVEDMERRGKLKGLKA